MSTGRIFTLAIACMIAFFTTTATYGSDIRFHIVERNVERGATTSEGERFSFRSVMRGSSSEQVALDEINQFRARHGLHALQHSEELNNASRRWSSTMRERRIFQHASSAERGGAGENIAMNHETDPVASARRAVQQWINSPAHRAFLLSRNITEAGVGGDGGYWTFRARARASERTVDRTVERTVDRTVVRSENIVRTQPVSMQYIERIVDEPVVRAGNTVRRFSLLQRIKRFFCR